MGKKWAEHVALSAKWSSHSNARGCLRHNFFFVAFLGI